MPGRPASRVPRVLGQLALLLLALPLAADTFWYEDVAEARRLRQPGTAAPEWRQALTLVGEALRKDVPEPRRAELEFLRGSIAFDLGDTPRAVQSLQFAVQREPENPLYRLWLGYAYEQDQRTTLAVQAFRAVWRNPRAERTERDSAAEWLAQLHEPVGLAELEPTERTVVPGGVIVHHRGEPYVAAVRDALASARGRVADRLGLELVDPTEVVIFFDAAEYRAYHEQRRLPRPEWSTACSAHGRIFTYPAAGARDQFQSTLIHEYTHLVLRASAGDRLLPCWLDEGLATLLSGQFADYREVTRRAPRLHDEETLNLPSFGVLERDEAYLAYAQSKAMAEELLRRFGVARFREYLATLAEGADAPAAFRQVYHLTSTAFLRSAAHAVAAR